MASTVLITGASQEMGRAIATEFARHGFNICGIYPNLIKSNFLERAIFRGNSAEDQQNCRQQSGQG